MSTTQNDSQTPDACKTILVVGDWIVDEYWFLVRHHSDTSSYARQSHYRIVSGANELVRDLCGAGLIARILYELRKYTFKDQALHDAITNIKTIIKSKTVSSSADIQKLDDLIKELDIVDHSLSCTSYNINHLNEKIDNINNLAHKGTLKLQSLPELKIFFQNEITRAPKEYKILGIGCWHIDDDDLIEQFIRARCQNEDDGTILRASAPLSMLKRGHKYEKVDIDLFKLGIRNKTVESTRETLHETIRVIRAYRYSRERFEQLYRIDWEQQRHSLQQLGENDDQKSLDDNEDNEQDKKSNTLLKNKLSDTNKRNPIEIVIVNDHMKGVIDEARIETIWESVNGSKNGNDGAHWFVRTKDRLIQTAPGETEWPKWLQKTKFIELLMVGPEISCRSYPSGALLTEKGNLAEHTYELIGKLMGRKESKDTKDRKIRNLVLTSDRLEVVTILNDICYITRPFEGCKDLDSNEGMELRTLNWTTAIFAALVYEIRSSVDAPDNNITWNNWNKNKIECMGMIDRAFSKALEHIGVPRPEILRLPTSSSRGYSHYHRSSDSRKLLPVTNYCLCSDIEEQWNDAKSVHNFGIIKERDKKSNTDDVSSKVDAEEHTKSKKNHNNKESAPSSESKGGKLQMWRMSTDLPGYIACIREKRDAILRMWEKINAFIGREDPDQPLSILLEADPGFGKSYLAERLAKNFPNSELLRFDITQMIERHELLDVFDRVADAQAQAQRRKPVFVFVDEINATLGGSPVYGAFLSPLEAKTYKRKGQNVELRPCIWIFAGTPERTDDPQRGQGQREKREDFMSRMTMIERIDYQSMMNQAPAGKRHIIDVQSEARLEQVYLGAKYINDAFSDVYQIDRDILKAFSLLPPEDAPARMLRRLASSLENVQYGQVHKRNCTSQEWKKIIDERILPQDRPFWRDDFNVKKVTWVTLELP